MSLFSAILSCFSSPNLDSADLTVDSLENTSKKAATSNSGPIVLFPEVIFLFWISKLDNLSIYLFIYLFIYL
mgnify:CR=1 FL=1